MIDQETLAGIKTGLVEGQGGSARKLLESMPHDELRRMRREIDAIIPRETLSDMDMPGELLSQYQTVLDLQSEVLSDEEVPANQKAQVAGQVASVLQQIIKMQGEFYTAERFRSIENMMIKHMKTLPLEVARKFLDEYEELGGA